MMLPGPHMRLSKQEYWMSSRVIAVLGVAAMVFQVPAFAAESAGASDVLVEPASAQKFAAAFLDEVLVHP
jgi:hypothetical protein